MNRPVCTKSGSPHLIFGRKRAYVHQLVRSERVPGAKSVFHLEEMRMIKREILSSQLNPQTAFGVLTDSEVLLVDLVQGRRVLSSRLLPPDSSELSRLFSYLWDTGLSSIWVMPATTLSRTATCARFEQVGSHW